MPRELDVWPRVSHPNIIRMHDYMVNEQKIYMILEYADGGDMLSYIQSINGPVGERDCKPWMRQILSAVAYLHRMDIIHRDLKLENLLIETSTRMIKLCDFGFSKDLAGKNSSTSLAPTSTTTPTQSQLDELSRTYCGSKAYASPGLFPLCLKCFEIYSRAPYSLLINDTNGLIFFCKEILLGQPYDPKKADVWAVGVIFFIFLTGNMPFREDKCNEVILNQVSIHFSKI